MAIPKPVKHIGKILAYILLTYMVVTSLTFTFVLISVLIQNQETDEHEESVGQWPSINVNYFDARFVDNKNLNVSFTFHLDRHLGGKIPDRFFFDFGDGSPRIEVYGLTIYHEYHESNWYDPKLLGNLSGVGQSVIWSVSIPVIQVISDDPVAMVERDRIIVHFGDRFILSGEGSYDMDGGIVGFFWEYGDGTFDDKTKGIDGFVPEPERIHHYEKTGRYSAKMYVMDSKGNKCQEPANVEVVIISLC